MHFIYIFTALALVVSLIANPQKTLKAIKIAGKKLLKIAPAFLSMLILVSVVLFLVPSEIIVNQLGSANKFQGLLLALGFGSIAIMPGFIAFPLCGILYRDGVPFMVISAFSTTLMMVGILTFPIEKEYLGIKVTVIRNLIGFFIALITALLTGFFFGEIASGIF